MQTPLSSPSEAMSQATAGPSRSTVGESRRSVLSQSTEDTDQPVAEPTQSVVGSSLSLLDGSGNESHSIDGTSQVSAEAASSSPSARSAPRRPQASLSETPRAARRRQHRRDGMARGCSELESFLSALRHDEEQERNWRREEADRADQRHQAHLRQLEMAIQTFQQVTAMAGELLRMSRYRPYPEAYSRNGSGGYQA